MSDEIISQPGGSGTERSGASATPQNTNRTEPGFEPTEDEKSVVKTWLDRVKRAEGDPQRKEWADSLKDLRGYVAGTKHDDKTGKKLTRTNMVFSTIASMMPNLYAKNPDIAVELTQAVPKEKVGIIKKFAATAETLLGQTVVVEPKLKKRAKANIRSTSNTGFGVLKMVFQQEFRGDPLIVRRINDAQDNLARAEAAVREAKDITDQAKKAQLLDEAKANMAAATTGNEVKIFKGFVVDRMQSEDFLILDDNIVEFDMYVEADALAQLVWMPVRDFKVTFKMDATGATKYAAPRSPEGNQGQAAPENMQQDEMFVCVVEIWDKKNGVVRTVAKGMNRWCREPYVPQHAPLRWYPFFLVGFNLIEGRWRPISDVELLMGLQDEYNTTRTNYADIRKRAVPRRIVRKAGNLKEEDIKAIVGSTNEEWIAVSGVPTTPISNDVMQLEGLKIDPQAYDVTLIRNDMDLMVGMSDAGRANLIKPKTATEAELMQEALQSRVGERRDTHEDMLSDMAQAGFEICLMTMSKEEVTQICGEDTVWPDEQLSAEEVQQMVTVRVRAGSSGKPNQAKEREQWGQLYPQIVEASTKIMELRANGQHELAEAMLELLRETLRRFDEQLDLDSIIPPMERDENGKPIVHQQVAQELMQCKEQLAACQEELAACQEELQKAQAGEQSKIAAEETKRESDRMANEREVAAGEAKAEFERWNALLQGAVKVMQTQITAAASANAENEEAQKEAMAAASSEANLNRIITELQKTVEQMGSAIQSLGKQQSTEAGT